MYSSRKNIAVYQHSPGTIQLYAQCTVYEYGCTVRLYGCTGTAVAIGTANQMGVEEHLQGCAGLQDR
jgi:hypothetical protein